MAKDGGNKPNAGGFAFTKSSPPIAETDALQAGQDSPVQVSHEGEATLHREPVQIPDGPVSKKKLEALAFNEELITVQVADSEDPNAERVIEVGVNGKKQFFKRGQPQTVKRKYVEALARAKVTNYSQRVDATDPLVMNRLNPRTALRYPFALLEDANPRGGQAWLRQIMSEAY